MSDTQSMAIGEVELAALPCPFCVTLELNRQASPQHLLLMREWLQAVLICAARSGALMSRTLPGTTLMPEAVTLPACHVEPLGVGLRVHFQVVLEVDIACHGLGEEERIAENIAQALRSRMRMTPNAARIPLDDSAGLWVQMSSDNAPRALA